MVTLKQIAARASVSVRTTSVVLNGKAAEGRISSTMVERILQIAHEMNYRPNAMARAMRMRKTSQIGVLVREISSSHTGEIIEAIENNLIGSDYRMLLGVTNGSCDVAVDYLSRFSHGIVDGILNLDPLVNSETFRRVKVQIPYLNFLRPSPGFTLSFDWQHGVNLTLDHLSELGHRRIGFLSGPKEDPSMEERLKWFQAYFAGRQGEGVRLFVEYGQWTFESGRALAPRLLEAGCTALVGANEFLAIGAVKAAQESGLRLPRDLSVVSLYGSSSSLMLTPSLSSLRFPIPETAKLTVEALLALVAGQSAGAPVLIKPSLIHRESTASVALAAGFP